jgi:hypothetical protein
MERMKNRVEGNIDRAANRFGDNLVYAGLFTVLFYGVGVADGDAAMAAGAIGFWSAFYALYAPFLIRYVAIREPPGDTWRAAAYIGYGAAPLGLFIPLWSELTAWPTVLVSYPLVVAWCVTAMVLAVLRRTPPAASRGRAVFLGGAGVIYAVAAGPVFVGFWIGLLTGRWTPPGEAYAAALAPLIIGIPFAAGAAYVAIELLGRASEIDRTVS